MDSISRVLGRIGRKGYPRLRGGSVTESEVEGCVVRKVHAWHAAGVVLLVGSG
jgi:hypothetical protein